ncbi:MAG: UDP-N-acetylmuramoyl-L-alanyl-D-glutamate--2,6-diaminopimelate ligase [Actinomycetota bacterium]
MQWTLRALVGAAALPAEVRGDARVGGLAYDPHVVQPGDLFCCIPGARHDGHSFAAEVATAGASALVVEHLVDVELPQAEVASVRAAMGPLAASFYEHPSGEMPVAAITGTNGKTTVTYLVEAIASVAGLEPGVVGTVSRRFKGTSEKAVRNTPEAPDLQRLLRRMRDAGVDLVVLEATSDGIEQGRLRGTTFATAAFTNLTQDHLNTHGSMEAYFEAKAALFHPDYVDRAVVNVGDEAGRRIVERASERLELLTYGSERADIRVESFDLAPNGSRARLRTPDGSYDIETSLVGRYNIDNCMCAFGMALHLGMDADDIVQGIGRLERVAGRLEPVDAGQPFLALIDYAHTPDALGQALGACRGLTTGRVVAVFGCGGDRDRAKRPLMGEAATRGADHTIITSDNPRSEDPVAIIADIEPGARRGAGKYTVIPDRREAIRAALDEAEPGDVVLVAGKGHEQGQEFADRTVPFDDREVVAELLGGIACRW